MCAQETDINSKTVQAIASLAIALAVTAIQPSAIAEQSDINAQPVFKGITEIVMVVEDLDKAVEQQWETFGIGPWEIWTLNPSNVKDMTIRGKPADYAIRVAYTKIGSIHWELIEPLDQNSTYYEFLTKHGEGIHNIVFDVNDYDKTLSAMKLKGVDTHNSGNWQGVKFTNFDTHGMLPIVFEIFHVAPGASFPPPERIYP